MTYSARNMLCLQNRFQAVSITRAQLPKVIQSQVSSWMDAIEESIISHTLERLPAILRKHGISDQLMIDKIINGLYEASSDTGTPPAFGVKSQSALSTERGIQALWPGGDRVQSRDCQRNRTQILSSQHTELREHSRIHKENTHSCTFRERGFTCPTVDLDDRTSDTASLTTLEQSSSGAQRNSDDPVVYNGTPPLPRLDDFPLPPKSVRRTKSWWLNRRS